MTVSIGASLCGAVLLLHNCGASFYYAAKQNHYRPATTSRLLLTLQQQQPNDDMQILFHQSCSHEVLPEVEAYGTNYGVLRPTSKGLSKMASHGAHGINQGRTGFFTHSTKRLERLGWLTAKSRPVRNTAIMMVDVQQTEFRAFRTFEERCRMYLPELEAYYEKHGVLRCTAKVISKEASNWAQHIKQGNIMFSGAYVTQLERLGLLTIRSKQKSKEPPVSFQARDRSCWHRDDVFEANAALYLPELESYFDKYGTLKPSAKEISKGASSWAKRIKLGKTLFLGSYVKRLERLGLLTERSKQMLRPGEEPVVFELAKIRKCVTFLEGCELYIPELEAYFETHGKLRYKSRAISKEASNWAHNVKHENYVLSEPYVTRLERLGLFIRKPKKMENGDS